jgi:hypothetical protein
MFFPGGEISPESGHTVRSPKIKRDVPEKKEPKLAPEKKLQKPRKKFTQTRIARWFILKPNPPSFGTFWKALEWKILIYFMTI